MDIVRVESYIARDVAMEEGTAPKAKVSHRLLRVLARLGTNSNYMGVA